MSRELKFRVFCNNEMFYMDKRKEYWDYLDNIDFMKKKVYINDYHHNLSDFYDFENVEINQYTGLKDKNGKEIYENDIVKLDNETYGKVVYEDGMYLIDFGNHNYDYLKDLDVFVEIVGNIYEHKNLLKREED